MADRGGDSRVGRFAPVTRPVLVPFLVGAGLVLGWVPRAAALDAKAFYDAASSRLKVTYQGGSVFEGTLGIDREGSTGGTGAAEVRIEEEARPLEPVLFEYGHGPRDSGPMPENLKAESLVVRIKPSGSDARVRLEGTVLASLDALACIPEGGPEMIRGCLGTSSSLLNRGVFDRQGDWAIHIDGPAKCQVQIGPSGGRSTPNSGRGLRFAIKAGGDHVTLRFQEGFYRRHRGYLHWKPDKALWSKPICGWCSWAAYGGSIKEQHMVDASEFFARNLKDYGYTIMQMDDGYQRLSQWNPEPLKAGESVAERWSVANDKFPHGLGWLAGEISQRGLTPGIWVGCYLPLGLDPPWYVAGADGKPYEGEWVNYAVNGLNEEAVDAAYLKTIRELKKEGWDYFKIDTIRHVIYDSYRKTPDYWAGRHEDADQAFRRLFSAIKREIGPETYMLSCWGAIPEMAGIPDGCRIGEDVSPGWGSACKSAHFASRFQYINNIIWRNDPDYMCLRWPLTVTEARSWATFVAMLGGQLMVSDPPVTYDEPRLDIMRKVAPPLPVRPTTLRQLRTKPELWALEIDQANAPYLILARIAWDAPGLAARDITMSEVGLDAGRTYLVWDFWNRKFLGEHKEKLSLDMIGRGDCRVYCIRPKLDRPQILSTDRHIGQGAYELRNVSWTDDKLSGELVVPGDRPFTLFIHVPEGYTSGRKMPEPVDYEQSGRILRLMLRSEKGQPVSWSVAFARAKK